MKTPNPVDPETELGKQIINSLLRDLIAATVAAGIHASHAEGYPEPYHVAKHAYDNADALLERSRTPGLIKQLPKL